MTRRILCLITIYAVIITAATTDAAQREATVFSDGILVELEASARKGLVEVALPSPIREGTVRVKPLDSGIIQRVELAPFKIPDKLQKELDSLTEQKSRLEDRMKALDTREGIFAAAAKSQSSKAPRKTKTNPDPLASVRQGTEFAIAQLEAVFTARRRTEHELKRVDARLSHLHRSTVGGPTVRVTVSPAAAHFKIAAVLQEGGWKARYEIRLQGDGTARVTMLADTFGLPDGFTARAVPAPLAAGMPQQALPLPPGASVRLAEWRLPVSQEQVANSPLPDFSFSMKNSSGSPLPAGQAAVFSSGEYLGTIPLPAAAPDAVVVISNNRQK